MWTVMLKIEKARFQFFNGPSPAIKVFNSKEEEILKVSDWIKRE